ncbi:MAG: shikimate dehydrogenase [Candidatus Cloacimonadota bacterium]|nr:MAG: shikimate dehydrogenase [Candidatus Cloacimonadota bacterium]
MRVLTLMLKTNQDLFQKINEYSYFDGFEIRGDKMVEPLDFDTLRLACKNKLLIYTCREENKDIKEIKTQYVDALNFGFDYVDCDIKSWEKLSDAIVELKEYLILSYHNFEEAKFSEHLLKVFEENPAQVKKIALMPHDTSQAFICLNKFERISGKKVLVLMGGMGQWSRLCYKNFGSEWSYFCLDEVAPGQVSTKQLKNEHYPQSKKDTSVYGIIGDPVEHSLSPKAHNFFFEKNKINAQYLRFPTTNLPEFFYCLPNFVNGLSVTMPHKQSVMSYCSKLDPLAKSCGSVNTLKRTADGFIGFNTDALGLRFAIKSRVENWQDYKILILGAGGVARAALSVFCDLEGQITIANRTKEKADYLANEFNVDCIDISEIKDLSNTIIIQATACGMGEDISSPIDVELLDKSSILFETVYFPSHTPMVHHANKIGAQVIYGQDLFIAQAIEQQKIWFDGECLDFLELEKELS